VISIEIVLRGSKARLFALRGNMTLLAIKTDDNAHFGLGLQQFDQPVLVAESSATKMQALVDTPAKTDDSSAAAAVVMRTLVFPRG
jgi:hypothetical protein